MKIKSRVILLCSFVFLCSWFFAGSAAVFAAEPGAVPEGNNQESVDRPTIEEIPLKKAPPNRQGTVAEVDRFVTIDFEEVDITLFIKYISELTGKNFIIDKSVRGNVTIVSPTKISIDEAYKVFESVLEVQGFTTVPAGSITKIVPSADARSKSVDTGFSRSEGARDRD